MPKIKRCLCCGNQLNKVNFEKKLLFHSIPNTVATWENG